MSMYERTIRSPNNRHNRGYHGVGHRANGRGDCSCETRGLNHLEKQNEDTIMRFDVHNTILTEKERAIEFH